MANWAYIENGQVVEKYESLPDNWRNISNFYVLKNDLEYLASLNWYPVVHPFYQFNPAIQTLDNVRYTVEGTTVTEEWDIVDIPKPPPPTLEEVLRNLQYDTQARLDNFASTRGYDNITTACSYNSDPNLKFRTEGVYCVEARSQTWTKLYEIIGDIRAGNRPAPEKFSDIEQELPLLEWPE